MVAIASVVGYLYLNGTFSSYSAGVTSCTTLEDVVSDLPSQYCSELVSLPFAPESVTAFNPSGDSITLYDTNASSPTYGKSAPLTKDARITLSTKNSAIKGVSVSSICSALVDGKTIATVANISTFSSPPRDAKVCSISIDGKTLQTQYYSPNVSTHIVSMIFKGTATYVYLTGRTESRSFSGSLGNITITITAPNPISGDTDSGFTVDNDKIGISEGGGGSVISSSSALVSSATATITTSDGEINPDYVKQTETAILTSSANTPIDVQVGTSTITVNACDVGSCSYSPPTTTGGTAEVTARVTESDKARYERDAAYTAQAFGGYENMTPYSKCAFFKQGC